MATPNYGYEKRQRELAKKKKKEEKLRAKAAGKRHDDPGHETEGEPATEPTEGAAQGDTPDPAGGNPA